MRSPLTQGRLPASSWRPVPHRGRGQSSLKAAASLCHLHGTQQRDPHGGPPAVGYVITSER